MSVKVGPEFVGVATEEWQTEDQAREPSLKVAFYLKPRKVAFLGEERTGKTWM